MAVRAASAMRARVTEAASVARPPAPLAATTGMVQEGVARMAARQAAAAVLRAAAATVGRVARAAAEMAAAEVTDQWRVGEVTDEQAAAATVGMATAAVAIMAAAAMAVVMVVSAMAVAMVVAAMAVAMAVGAEAERAVATRWGHIQRSMRRSPRHCCSMPVPRPSAPHHTHLPHRRCSHRRPSSPTCIRPRPGSGSAAHCYERLPTGES